MKTSDLINRVPASSTISMAQKARDLAATGIDIISLTLGEPDFDTPDFIKEAGKKALDDGFTKYSPIPGLVSLREAIVSKFKRENNLDYTIDQIVVSTGAKQTLANIVLCTINEGDEVLLPAPYWVSYEGLAIMAKGKVVVVKTNIDNDFKINAAELKAHLTEKTKLMIFSSPCNPTGSLYSQAELESLAEVIKEYPNLLVVSDEIYEHINFTGTKNFSIGSIPSIKEQVVTVNGMAKGFSMTGWRIGYMGAPLWLAKACTKLQGQFTSGANTAAQKASEVALNASLDETLKMRDIFLERRDLFLELLGKVEGLKLNVPEGAFYVFPDVSSYFGKSFGEYKIENDSDVVRYLLEVAHVATVDGESFGNGDCIRLSYAASKEKLVEAADRIKTALDRLV